MKVNRKLVYYLAGLSYLKLEEEEIDYFLPQLNEILDYAGKISELDLENIPPTSSAVDVSDAYREDKKRVFENREGILRIAASMKNDMFSVPPVINKAGDA